MMWSWSCPDMIIRTRRTRGTDQKQGYKTLSPPHHQLCKMSFYILATAAQRSSEQKRFIWEIKTLLVILGKYDWGDQVPAQILFVCLPGNWLGGFLVVQLDSCLMAWMMKRVAVGDQGTGPACWAPVPSSPLLGPPLSYPTSYPVHTHVNPRACCTNRPPCNQHQVL